MPAIAGSSTSVSTITRSSTINQPIAICPRWLSISCRSSNARSNTTVLAVERHRPNTVSKADESLSKLADEETEEQKEAEKALEPFVERVKNLLGERVKEVRLTHRLTDTPAIVTTDANEMTTQMAKLFAAAGQEVPEVKYLFEINPDHPLVKRVADTQDETRFGEWIELLLDQALLAERGTLDDPNQFIRRMNQLLTA